MNNVFMNEPSCKPPFSSGISQLAMLDMISHIFPLYHHFVGCIVVIPLYLICSHIISHSNPMSIVGIYICSNPIILYIYTHHIFYKGFSHIFWNIFSYLYSHSEYMLPVPLKPSFWRCQVSELRRPFDKAAEVLGGDGR